MIQITDVTLRDGLQMEAKVPTKDKVALYKELLHCGYQRLEVTSFVHPKWVPQFEDAEALLTEISKIETKTETMAFVPNTKGMERFLKFQIPWATTFVAASETFNKKNVNATIDETLADLKNIVALAKKENRKVRIYVSTVFGCPYEGKIDPKSLLVTLKKVVECEPHEVALSDTIGVALPKEVKEVVDHFAKLYPQKNTALHLHNTYGLAMANIMAGFENGIRLFDGSTGGIGGCPYAKGATGNAASDEIQYVFSRLENAVFNLEATKKVFANLRTLKVPLHSSLSEIESRGGTVYGI